MDLRRALITFLALLFVLTAVYFVWNYFETPTIIIGERSETTGKIKDIKFVLYGRGHVQRADYFYIVDDSVYFDQILVGPDYGKQHVGNRIVLEYDVNNPERHKIVKFIPDFKETVMMKGVTPKKVGYCEIILTNDIVSIKDYGVKGRLEYDYLGYFYTVSDTIYVNPIKCTPESGFEPKTFVYVEDNKGVSMIDIDTKKVFR
ncbi:MAG: hypothetical protein N4A72_19090 [Bacteroidales bacterium]|nr:hypothetical protein [Bacteroidales bacterium]